MKLTLTGILVAVAFFLQACATTSTYDLTPTPQENHPWLEKQSRTYHDLLAEAKENPAQIVTTDGQHHEAWITRADADSIGWRDAQDSTLHLLPASQVQSLEITRHYHLWWLGGLVGLVGATVPSVASGGWEETNGGHPYRAGVVGAALTGTLVGGILGGAIHHTDQYLTGTNGSADSTKSR